MRFRVGLLSSGGRLSLWFWFRARANVSGKFFQSESGERGNDGTTDSEK